MDFLHELADQVFSWFKEMGGLGIMLGLMIEIIPSEIVLAYGGYLVSLEGEGHISFIEAVVYGTIGGVIAQIFVYWLGRYGGRPFVEKYGKYILIKKSHIEVSEKWFNKYGTGMIFTARFIPVVRHAISIPAGMARMPLWRFTVLTTLAVIPWSIGFVYLGMKLGKNWETIDEEAKPYILPIIIGAVLLTAGYVGYKIWHSRKSGVETAGAEGEALTKHQLRFIGSEYKVLHDVSLKARGGTQQFDHIVVGPNGVFHIDSKHWSGVIRFTEQGVERSSGDYSGDPTAQLYRHEYVMKELLREAAGSLPAADIVGVICFTHPNCTIEGKSPAFTTVKLDRLQHVIRTYKGKHTLSASQVREVYDWLKKHIV